MTQRAWAGIGFQIELAKKMLTAVRTSVFDSVKYFDNAEVEIVGTTQVSKREGKYDVLSVAAQKTIPSLPVYRGPSSEIMQEDAIGVFICAILLHYQHITNECRARSLPPPLAGLLLEPS